MMENKTILIVGGLAVGAAILFVFLKQQQANQVAALNQPGLLTQPSVAANVGLSNIILGASNGVSNFLAGLGGGGGTDPSGLNDPGLEFDDATAFPGMDYTYANSNSYSTPGIAAGNE